jgi:hypothetical protein
MGKPRALSGLSSISVSIVGGWGELVCHVEVFVLYRDKAVGVLTAEKQVQFIQLMMEKSGVHYTTNGKHSYARDRRVGRRVLADNAAGTREKSRRHAGGVHRAYW